MVGHLKELYEAILEGCPDVAKMEVEQALAKGDDPSDVLEVMVRAMDEVGLLFEKGQYFAPEMLSAGRAMKAGLALLNPKIQNEDIQLNGTVISGSVKGDLHDIGKNLVGMMLESAGLDVIDLGSDVSPEAFLSAVKDNQPDLLLLSASLTTTLPSLVQTIETLKKAGARDDVKVLVGGAAVTAAYAEKIGADGYAPDARHAVEVAKSLL